MTTMKTPGPSKRWWFALRAGLPHLVENAGNLTVLRTIIGSDRRRSQKRGHERRGRQRRGRVSRGRKRRGRVSRGRQRRGRVSRGRQRRGRVSRGRQRRRRKTSHAGSRSRHATRRTVAPPRGLPRLHQRVEE
ncbi:arginine/serine-rich coiled-coil protein 2-like [Gadus chalcogrammus]|uniref:arginine/serine-rich coiled-coil protein 2-like n=1 Tax=Gadus chalcogrammus TaxID=1042646 RepID=UPI0024C49239|nr:arginine/serine-rich coiled-coil protein 2-like [Gadus chalcogrammus]XP_056468464.1 arginine/serine-rich coiled-coil protein 2-like [Gadus chalcogrammus]